MAKVAPNAFEEKSETRPSLAFRLKRAHYGPKVLVLNSKCSLKSRDVFALAIKIIGFIVLLQGLRNLVESLMILQGYVTVRSSTPNYWAVWGLIKIVVGVYFLAAMTPLVNLAFPLKPERTDLEKEASDASGAAHLGKSDGRLGEPKFIFGIIVKTIGLIVLLYGVEYLVDAFLYPRKPNDSRGVSNQQIIVFGVVQAAAGLAIMRGMVPLEAWAFPEEKTQRQPEAEKPGTEDKRPDA